VSAYRQIVRHYENCLEKHGDCHRGVDSPSAEYSRTQYRVMLDVVRPGSPRPSSLLDFGCGASHLYGYLVDTCRDDVIYSGLDLSPAFVALSRKKYPQVTYYCADLLKDGDCLPQFDYIVLNGVFTEKRSLSFDEMWAYVQLLLPKVFAKARRGISFNVFSKHVDWERDDLFHLPYDTLAAYLVRNLTRHFLMRNDYGLYEYTTYVYHEPPRPDGVPARGHGKGRCALARPTGGLGRLPRK
jgi:hypothetical protein